MKRKKYPRKIKFKTSFLFVLIPVVLLLLLGMIGIAFMNRKATMNSAAEASTPAIYWGVMIDTVPQSIAALTTFETNAGKPVSMVMWFQGWGVTDGTQNFQTDWMNSVRSHGAIPSITWEPSDGTGAVNEPAYQLKNIYNGTYDAYITKWAQDSKAWGHPYFLRFAGEMNANWTPWDEQVNGNQPGDFVKAWKHVHDIFTANGATNVTWVWCPNIDDPGVPTSPLAELYPGDAYVDWIGMDGYNWGTSQSWGSIWQSFSQVFQTTYNELQTIAPTKPIVIGETGSSELGGNKAAWITDMFTTQLQTNFPNIKAVTWFNLNKETDWRIESSAQSQYAFAQAIASSYYASNQFANLTASPILPLTGSNPTQTPIPTVTPSLQPTVTPTPTPSVNLLQNGSFDTGNFNPWYFQITGLAGGTISLDSSTKIDGRYSAKTIITRSNSNYWYVQFGQNNIPLVQGQNYKISFWAKASKNRNGEIVIQKDASPYTVYLIKEFALTTSWKNYTYSFTSPVTLLNSDLNFNIAQTTGQVWLDKVSMQ